jgi:hypothetical protein
MSSITSIDTNILILLWIQDPVWNQRAGAHASVRGYSLLSMDQDIYRAAFPGLQIDSP